MAVISVRVSLLLCLCVVLIAHANGTKSDNAEKKLVCDRDCVYLSMWMH